MSRWRTSGVPLAVLAGGGAFAGCLSLIATMFAFLGEGGAQPPAADRALAAGLAVSVAVAAGFAAGSVRIVRRLRVLRADAVRRLKDPTAPLHFSGGRRLGVWSSSEIAELARTLDALHLRVRMSDDVAERHRRSAETASAGMFELLSGLVAAEEGARGQLSAELHDTVAQSLMLARSTLALPMLTDDEVRHAADLVAEAEDQVRAVMARTRPPALRDGDLARAVAALREDLMNRYGLEVQLRWPTVPYPLPLATAITVYRFFQEALLNVVKHADVDDALAALTVDDEWVTAVVRDEGPGFDPDQVRPERGRHVGLGLLRERARLAGGSLEVTSWPEDATTLTLRLPRAAPGPGLLPAQRSSVA